MQKKGTKQRYPGNYKSPENYVRSVIVGSCCSELDKIMLLRHLTTIHSFEELWVIKLVRVNII